MFAEEIFNMYLSKLLEISISDPHFFNSVSDPDPDGKLFLKINESAQVYSKIKATRFNL